MPPTAGLSHDIVFTLGSDSYGFMLKPGTQLEERVNDFAPQIGLGDNPAFAEGAWRAWEFTGATEGVDQRIFNSKQRCLWTDGNIDTLRDGLIQLSSAWASSDAAQVATAPMIIDYLTNLVLVGIGVNVRRYSVSGGTWAAATTSFANNCLWLHVHGVYCFAAVGASSSLWRTTDGDTWTQPAAQVASCFETYADKIWLGTGATIKSSSDNGATWSAAVSVGDGSANVTALKVAYNNLFIRTEDGLYYSNGTTVTEVYRNRNALYSGNKILVYHTDGFLYVNELATILKFSISSGAVTNMVKISPSMSGDASKELYGHGVPKWMWSGVSKEQLFAAFDDGEGVYPEVMQYNGLGWHQIYRGTSGDTMTAGGYSRLAAFLLLNDGATRRKKMLTLTDIPAADYPTTGDLYTSYFDASLPQMPKGFGAVRIWCRNVSSTKTVAVYYRTVDTDSWTLLGTVTADVYPNPTTILFSTTNKAIGANAIQLRFLITTDSATVTPVITRVSVKYLNRPASVHAYSALLQLA